MAPAARYGQKLVTCDRRSRERRTHGQPHESQRHQRAEHTARVKGRQDQQAQRVVGDGQQQEKGNRWMAAENHSRDERAEGDVGGARHRPAPRQLRAVASPHDGDVEDGRTSHPADRGNHGEGRTPPRVQGAARRGCLDDLLRRQREEERHPHVVDGEVQAAGNRLVAVKVEIGPDERDDGAERQEQGGQVQSTSRSPVRIL